MGKAEGRRQIFLNMRARSGQCVSVAEISQMLSEICEFADDLIRRKPMYCKW